MTTLQVGERAPAFDSVDENGDPISLSNYIGKKLILFFYPKDDSPGCTKEACNLRDNYRALTKAGYEILGVSPDKYTKHKKFIDKYEFQYSLVADPDKTIINDYACWGPKKFMGREVTGVYRTTFLINEQGVIDHIITKVKTKDHAQQILEQAQQMAVAQS